MNRKILEIVCEAIKEKNAQLQDGQQMGQSTETELYGKGGVLDSLGLVGLLASIEERVDDIYDVTITIADERALSKKHSPFRTVGSLVDYIDVLLKEEQ